MHIERQLHRGPEEGEESVAIDAAQPVVKTEGESLLPLKSEPEVLEDRYKLVFYVPQNALEVVKTAVFAAGAGSYPGGKYEWCCFETIGTGQFHPVAEKGANPTIGTREGEGYRVERVLEVRCEVTCISRGVLVAAVAGLKRYVAGGFLERWMLTVVVHTRMKSRRMRRTGWRQFEPCIGDIGVIVIPSDISSAFTCT